MATGTGLPSMNSAAVLAQAPGGTSADSLFAADSWNKIAAAGAKLAESSGDYLKTAEHQALIGHLSESDNIDRRKRIELQDQFSDDPQGFDSAWKGYADGKLSSVDPQLVNHVRATLGSEGNAAYGALVNTKRATIQSQAKQSWTAQEDQAANDVTGAAMAGTLIPNGPDGEIRDPRVLKYHGVVDAGVTSQFIPREEADRRSANVESTATVYAARTGIQNTFNAEGPIAAIKDIDDVVRNENLKLSPDQRLGLATRLRADVHGWDAERRQSLEAVDERAKALLQARMLGTAIPDGEISNTLDQYKRFGGQAQAASFLADMQNADKISFVARSPLSESSQWLDRLKTERGFNSPPQAVKTAMDYFQSQGYTPAQAAGIAGNLFHESGFNPNAVHDFGTGLGIAGWRKERLDALKGFARAKGTAPNDFQTQLEFTTQELRTTEAGADAALRAATTPQDAAAAFINFERPQGYDPTNISASHGYANRVALATKFAGGGTVPALPSDIALIGRANKIVVDRVSTEADDIIKGMADKDNPVLPTEQRINDLLTAASATNTPEVLDRVSKAAAEYQFRRQFGRAPLPEETAFVSDLQRKAVTEGLSTTDARLLQLGMAARDSTAKALQDDPLAHTVSAWTGKANIPPLGKLDMSSSPAFQASLAARAQWAAFGTKNFETPTAMPALTADEVTQVRATLDATTDPAAKARIYGDIVAATSGGTRAATLAKLGAKGVDGMVEAFAGAMMALDGAPSIGESIIRGQAAMKTKSQFNPMKDGNKDDTVAALDKYLPAHAFSLAGRTDPQGQYAVTRSAVLARAADLAATDPQFAGTFTDALLHRATADVTGGVVIHNGAPLITPQRGMTQRGFDEKMYGLTDQDLQGVTTLQGTPIRAEDVRQRAKLESVSDGRYLVRFGNDVLNYAPAYAFRDLGVMGRRQQVFILDMRPIAPNTHLFDPMALSNALP